MFPFHDTGMMSGLVLGSLFGLVLERSGFGSPLKLTAQFRLTDWSVFKVMFTAIVVAALGLWLLRLIGWLQPDAVTVPQAALMGAAVGGAMVGAGFAVGGYCPGTSMVGLSTGRLDALVFVLGLLCGTSLFAWSYGPELRSLMAYGLVVDGDTVTDAYGVSEALMLFGMVLALVIVFLVGSWFERRAPGHGPVTAEQALDGAR